MLSWVRIRSSSTTPRLVGSAIATSRNFIGWRERHQLVLAGELDRDQLEDRLRDLELLEIDARRSPSWLREHVDQRLLGDQRSARPACGRASVPTVADRRARCGAGRRRAPPPRAASRRASCAPSRHLDDRGLARGRASVPRNLAACWLGGRDVEHHEVPVGARLAGCTGASTAVAPSTLLVIGAELQRAAAQRRAPRSAGCRAAARVAAERGRERLDRRGSASSVSVKPSVWKMLRGASGRRRAVRRLAHHQRRVVDRGRSARPTSGPARATGCPRRPARRGGTSATSAGMSSGSVLWRRFR